jgi:hypothetical protein
LTSVKRKKYFGKTISHPWYIILKKTLFIVTWSTIVIFVGVLLFFMAVLVDFEISAISDVESVNSSLFGSNPLTFLISYMPLTLLALLVIPFLVLFGFLAALYESTNDPTLEGSWVFGVRKTVELFVLPIGFLFVSLLIWGLVIVMTQFFGSLIHTDIPSILLIPTIILFILLEPIILLTGILIALIKFILDFVKEIKKV